MSNAMSVVEALAFIWAVGTLMMLVLSGATLSIGDSHTEEGLYYRRRGAKGILLCWAWPVVLIVMLVRAAR